MASKKGTRLADVARLAGVSLATASRVLSYSAYPVNPLTKKKVFEAAEELRYYPALHSSANPQDITPIIAVIVPTLQNPFFNEVILGVESCASKSGFQIMVFSSHRSVEEERKNINSLLRTRVTALIIISIDTNSETLDHFILCGGRVALLESNFRLRNSLSARTNYIAAGRLAAEHLIACGHRNIAFLTSPLTKSYRRTILTGVREALREAGLRMSDSCIYEAKAERELDNGHYEFEMGKQLIREFLQNKASFTAIIAINDLTALGIIQALAQNNISVPHDISVISFDNIPYSNMISPPLTTVDLPSVTLGASSCNMLIESLTSSRDGPNGIILEFEGKLIERSSVRHIHSS